MRPAFFTIALAGALLGAAAIARAEMPRDPMRPPSLPGRAAPQAPRKASPVLSAVLTFQGRRTAIFDGRLVHDGSVVGVYTIDSVLPDGVRYRDGHLTHELHLAHPGTPIKKPAAEPAHAASGESP